MAWEWPVRILIALALTGALGFEREARRKAAGLRTHMLAVLHRLDRRIPGEASEDAERDEERR
jgi:uncharacterized membrane protein YhiD involved in acid resistance